MSLATSHRRRRVLIACALAGLSLASTPAAEPPSAGSAPALQIDVQRLLARPDLAAYRGWLKYLRFDAQAAAVRDGAASETARGKANRLAEWAGRIAADPRLLSKLTGVQEWAYESAADDSGQPFKIAIPTDYDPTRPAAMSVYMHGWSGNHLEHSGGMASQPGLFQLAVLGRGRGGGYRALSEADVLGVVDYVQSHWAIDPKRIRLGGGSMGGGGTYRLGSRYPQRWAAGSSTCGYASFVPVGNMITYPIYATHSADDPVVSALHDRGPLAKLRELGGQVIYDETSGYGHAVWGYAEGNRRSDAWAPLQVCPDSTTVRRIDYTATDGGAVRGWWAEVAEWGERPMPARFALTVGNDNTLFAELTNINRLRIRLSESPLERPGPVRIVVNGGLPITHATPVPTTVVIARDEHGWRFETKSPNLPFRLHTPGSASLLYTGDPLLIVYGTHGTETENHALRRAAEAASKSSNPSWLGDAGETGPDGVPHVQNLYGALNLKPDTDVSASDIARCHLVLIGTAAQNGVVERMAGKLPVRFTAGRISCDDGFELDGRERALGLVHYNPLAPDRLVFWVASASPETYAAGALIPMIMGGGPALCPPAFGADLLVMDATRPTLVAARSFDSRWRWSRERDTSRMLPAALKMPEALARAVGLAIRQAAGADYAFVTCPRGSETDAIVPGTTRVCDVRSFYYFGMIGLLDVSGAELVQLAAAARDNAEATLLLCSPKPFDPAAIAPEHHYMIALTGDAAGGMAREAHTAPGTYRLTDLSVGDAVERHLAAE